ncbi:unnamed protein product [Tilletia laevis]|uniref:GATA-type domain-containing protein n=2 Tax=Tilletia TaxID=13289 RepID=A0A9N8M4E9_9BASI|nr:hypothetical protein CF336_g3088 [Tilletia laevis]KAE8256521.1 hypothetical protein A4X03_0g5323 [Tilletia caries]CAD6884424.1 unnamed protein product [Tilletia caries]CAD6952460.1 unnamed protein product [Tilletia laevis]CAD6961818.1 unnamed protein product [Tilletia laevis]
MYGEDTQSDERQSRTAHLGPSIMTTSMSEADLQNILGSFSAGNSNPAGWPANATFLDHTANQQQQSASAQGSGGQNMMFTSAPGPFARAVPHPDAMSHPFAPAPHMGGMQSHIPPDYRYHSSDFGQQLATSIGVGIGAGSSGGGSSTGGQMMMTPAMMDTLFQQQHQQHQQQQQQQQHQHQQQQQQLQQQHQQQQQQLQQQQQMQMQEQKQQQQQEQQQQQQQQHEQQQQQQHEQEQQQGQHQQQQPDQQQDGFSIPLPPFFGGEEEGSAAAVGAGAGASNSATAAAAGAIVSDFTKRKGWSTRIVEELLDFVHVLDFSGRILFAAPGVVSITGWKPEELVGKEVVEFIHPNDRMPFVREFAKLVDAFLASQQTPLEQQGGFSQMQTDGPNPSPSSMGKRKASAISKGKGKGRANDSGADFSGIEANVGLFSDPSTASAAASTLTRPTTVFGAPLAPSTTNATPPADLLFYYRFAKKPLPRRADLLRTKSLSRLTFADALASGNVKMGTPGPSILRPGMGGRLPSHAAALSRSASRFTGSDAGSGLFDDGSGIDSNTGMSLDGFDGMGMMMGGTGMGRGSSTIAMSTPGLMKHTTPSRPGGGVVEGSDDEGGAHDPYVDREWVVFEVAGHVYVPPPDAFTAAAYGPDGDDNRDLPAGRTSADLGERRRSTEANRRDHADEIGPSSIKPNEWPPEAVDNVRCVFCSCRVYPSKNVTMFDSFLELKVENERLRNLLGEADAAAPGQGQGEDWRNEDGSLGPGVGDTSLDAGFVGDILASLDDDFDDKSHRQRPSITALSRGPSVMGHGSGMGSPTSPVRPLGSTAILDDEDELSGYHQGSGMDGGSTDDIKRKSKKMRTEEGDHVCTDCGRVDSPEWRKGPLGPKTLCNACGLRWAKKIKRKGGDPNATASAMAQATANAGRLVPTSPTYSSTQNS